MLGMVACTLFLAGLDVGTELVAIGIAFLLLNLFAATQDVAVDGYAVDVLHGRDLGPANAAQVGGFKLGNIVGGGVLLALIGVIGWRGDFLIMAACVGLTLALVLAVPEPPSVARDEATTWAITKQAFSAVFRVPGFALFLLGAKFGETFGGTPVKPTLVDLGYSAPLIGSIDGIVGGLSTVGGALAGGGVAVAVFVLAMSRCRPHSAAAEFTAMQVVYMAGAALAAPIAGAFADAIGVLPVMLAGAAMAIAIGLAALWRGHRLDPA
jgi:PAT family beta-lactamase induction signal transducer AmpG